MVTCFRSQVLGCASFTIAHSLFTSHIHLPMKSAVQKSSIPATRIFVAKELKDKHFDPTWHAHNEYQLFLVLKGTGTRFIGKTVKSFTGGDLTFLGPGIPHLWRSDSIYFDRRNKHSSAGLVVYFKNDLIAGMLDKEEMQQISKLFAKAKRGIEYRGEAVKHLTTMMKQMVELRGPESIIALLRMLVMMARTPEYSLLHNADYQYKLKDAETQRINIVYNYAAQHFQSGISLNDAAALLNMTPTSFSRYFRMKTSKSFSEFIAELRIRHACKLLAEDDRKSISQVSYGCGFNTLSNFNRIFRQFMKTTPKDYRKAFSSL